MSVTSEILDVAVVGGGPSGSALAIRLARAGLRVALLECRVSVGRDVGVTLPADIARRLRALGQLESFRSLEPVPSAGVRIAWGRAEAAPEAETASAGCCGWVVNRSVFDASLRARACEVGARVHIGATLRDVRRTLGGFTLVVGGIEDEATTELYARVVVDATGRSAMVAQRLGSVRRLCDNLVGIAQHVWCRDDGRPALIEAAANGWWYTSPVAGSDTIAFFLTDADLLVREWIDDAASWRTMLDGAPLTAARVGDALPLGGRWAFSASTHVLDRSAGDGWLAVGDAAVGHEPISGRGIDFALSSAEGAAETILLAFAGRRMAWREYDAKISREGGAYRLRQMRYYALEQRWPNSPFWRRRRPELAAA